MTVYVGLFRAVNVGGHAPLRMPVLTDLIRRHGFEGVRTVLQSGNVVFKGPFRETADLEKTLEQSVSDKLSLTTNVFVRTGAEWRTIVERNPFPTEAEHDPAHLVVVALKRSPSREQWASLLKSVVGRERIVEGGREAYVVYPDGIGRSKLTPALIELKLATRVTSRNWNTVLKLDQLASS